MSRAHSLSRTGSFTRNYTSYAASKYATDYASASRRSSVFDGYSGFAIYSSISQGLDEITYGGRLSRRNSFSDKRTNVGYSKAMEYTLPTLLATYEATRASSASQNQNSESQSLRRSDNNANGAERRVRGDKRTEAVKKDAEGQALQVKPKPKLNRRVSFTEKKPVIIDAVESEEPKKPSRSKRETKDPTRKKVKVKKEEKRKSQQPSGQDLVQQVSDKLKQFELESEVKKGQIQTVQIVSEPAKKPVVRTDFSVKEEDIAFGDCSSSSSKGMTSSEASPPQKPKVNRNSFAAFGPTDSFPDRQRTGAIFSSFSDSSEPQPEPKPRSNRNSGIFSSFYNSGEDKSSVKFRESKSGDSKSSSKRNSLDGKSVQCLAQDLAAECAKAYALMESSLSKLSADFGMGGDGPFGKSKVINYVIYKLGQMRRMFLLFSLSIIYYEIRNLTSSTHSSFLSK